MFEYFREANPVEMERRGIDHVDLWIPDYHSNKPHDEFMYRKRERQFFKTHLQGRELLARGGWMWKRRLRGVVICRDPVDCLVSFWHFKRRYPDSRKKVSPEVDRFVTEELAGWITWYASWLQCLSHRLVRERSCIVFYEQLAHDPQNILASVLRFTGVNHPDPLCVRRAVESCDFKVLQEGERLEEKHSGERFFRKGEVGGGLSEVRDVTIEVVREETSGLLEELRALAMK